MMMRLRSNSSYRTVLDPGADVRTDLPRHPVWRDGELVDEPSDVADLRGPVPAQHGEVGKRARDRSQHRLI
ncbi:hypothetical protein [Nocardioides sp. InS609-2]|uniref:hypothetical protein n=1 Tax=Nocardioides sp. InS609-2 TaxID=2760705 RepID=UPI0020BE23EC|nr:hypothetical protein [Nocardioides sp. InS609-2]